MSETARFDNYLIGTDEKFCLMWEERHTNISEVIIL